MKREHIRDLLTSVRTGDLDVDAALALMNPTGVDELDVAVVDTGRLARTGHPEVVFGQGKEAEDIVAILERLHAAEQPGGDEVARRGGVRATRRARGYAGRRERRKMRGISAPEGCLTASSKPLLTGPSRPPWLRRPLLLS